MPSRWSSGRKPAFTREENQPPLPLGEVAMRPFSSSRILPGVGMEARLGAVATLVYSTPNSSTRVPSSFT